MLIAITGQMGSGKTLLMVVFSQIFKPFAKIFANFDLKGSFSFNSLKELEKIENAVVLADEFWLTADSRIWRNNVKITHYINQLRKKSVVFFYTTQNFGQIDVRIRQATDFLVFCVKRKNFYEYHLIDLILGKEIKVFNLDKEKAKYFYSLYNTFQVISPLKIYEYPKFKKF